MTQSELDAAKVVFVQKVTALVDTFGMYKEAVLSKLGSLDVMADDWSYYMLDAAEKVRRARDAVQRVPVPAGITIIPDVKG